MGAWICDIPTVKRMVCSTEQLARATAELFDSIYIEGEKVPRKPGSPRVPKKRREKPRRDLTL